MTANASTASPKLVKWLRIFGVCFVLYSVIGFFVVPAVVKSQMLQRLPALTKRKASIDGVKFNPYTLALTVDGLSLKEANGDVFSSFSELYVNFQVSSIFRGAWTFDEISLKDPFAQVVYFKDGTFNFANLLGSSAPAPTTAPQKPQELPAVLVFHLIITNGTVAFTDMTRKTPFNTRYQPINVNLTDFTTVRDKSSAHEILATGDSGETFGVTGNITVNPLRADGSIRVNGLKLSRYNPYSQDYAMFDIADGQLDLSTDYRYDSATNALDLAVTNTRVTLSHFQLKTVDTGESLVSIPSLLIKDASASLVRHEATVGQVQSSGGSVLIRQNADGTINLLAGLVSQPVNTNSAPPAAAPWTVKIDDVAFDNYSIKAEDKQPTKPAEFDIDQLAFDVKNVSNLSNAPVAVSLSLRMQQTGTVGVTGNATLIPPSADVTVGVTNLDVRIVQPYLDEQVKMAITHGALSVNGHARYSPAGQGAPLVSFAGDVSVKNFAVTDEVLYDDLVKWESLDITGIDAALQPDKFHVDKINFSKPESSVIIDPDRRINVMNVVPPKKSGPAPTNPPPPMVIPELTLGEFAFQDAQLHFADHSIEPNCVFDVEKSSGSVKNISSLVQEPSEVMVRGNVNQFSTFSVTGKLNPLPDRLFVDLSVALTNTGLTDFSPYTEVYVGRPLQKGKLSLALHYNVQKMALDSQNDIFIDQLTLGAKNDSTNATHLPVKLAIALLKDRKGRIKLDVPVNGRLDDPKFDIWPVIWHVVDNLIVKAATSPFSLLGSMFGGGPELSYVAFDPGHANISGVETNKLNTLTKALYERPELTMEINGSVDPGADHDEMVHARFDRQIKALLIKEMTAAGKPPVSEDEITLQPADYARLIPVDYTNTFGAYHPSSTNQPAATNQTAPAHGPMVSSTHVLRQTTTTRKISPYEHGANRMIDELHPVEIVQVVQRTRAPIFAQAPPGVAAVPQDALDDMQAQLLQKITITPDDYRQLMQDRASQVEAYLLKSGQVTADRLFITVPKSIGPNFKGEDRVNLTLD
jgi:hypothetical protein